MTGRELMEAMTRTGQERAARRLVIESRLVTPEKAAVMTCEDICDVIAKEYVMVGRGEDRIMLVRKSDEKAFWSLVKCLDR